MSEALTECQCQLKKQKVAYETLETNYQTKLAEIRELHVEKLKLQIALRDQRRQQQELESLLAQYLPQDSTIKAAYDGV